MVSLLLRVEGQVQGVGFRAHVARWAEGTGVRGRVWNEADSGVGIIAQHDDPAALDGFMRQLGNGPGRVESVTSNPYQGEAYDDFRIVKSSPE